MQNLTIGLTNENPVWILFLKQLGIPFSIYELKKSFSPFDFSVLIVSHSLNKQESSFVREYLQNGGSVLLTFKNLKKIIKNFTYKNHKIDFILPEPHPLFNGISIIDLYTRGVFSKKANLGHLQKNSEKVFFSSPFGKGIFLAIPFDPTQALMDKRRKRKAFFFDSPKFPDECVSSVSKGELRKFLFNALIYLHHKRSLPFVHLWFYPKSLKTAFAFRTDTDFALQEHLINFHKIAKKHSLNFTWFIDVKSQENFPEVIKKLSEEGEDIQVHCFKHFTYSDEKKNFENIVRAKEWLISLGIKPKGFSAPQGIWNEPLNNALEKLNFSYSSEFSYSYDDFPSFPILQNKKFSSVIQIPVHPISAGNLHLAHFTISGMIDYFKTIIEWKYNNSEPIFLYGHPVQGYENVLDSFLTHLKEKKDIWFTNFTQFSEWWNERDKTSFSIETDRKTLISNCKIKKRDDIFLHIISFDGKETYFPLSDSTIELSTLNWKENSSKFITQTDIQNLLKTKKRKLKLMAKSLEHFIRIQRMK